MKTLLGRAMTRIARTPTEHGPARASAFFDSESNDPVDSPTGFPWTQSVPMPDGTRTRGLDTDPARILRLWEACFGEDRNALAGQSVLDAAADDGYFTLAAMLSGAESVVALETSAFANLRYASQRWALTPTFEKRNLLDLSEFGPKYDSILFFGGLNRLPNVYAGMKKLESLLAPGGQIYLEAQLADAKSDLPYFEFATPVDPDSLRNQPMLPNDLAVRTAAAAYGLVAIAVTMEDDREYERSVPGQLRRVYILKRMAEGPVRPKG